MSSTVTMHRSEVEPKAQCKQDGAFIVRYKGSKYDISRFLRLHPGGSNTVSPFKNLSITEKFLQTNHSPAAAYLLKEYMISRASGVPDNDDLENLVDWNKPMLGQVCKLGLHYKEWIAAPVDRRLRLFHSNLLENLTITPWYVIPLIWIPVTIFFLYLGLSGNSYQITDSISVLRAAFGILFGVVIWSLMEYSVHRWVFHLQPPDTSPVLITLHFLLHGVHHKVPFDDRRLVFPPFPAGIVAVIIYYTYRSILPEWLLYFTLAGTAAGYTMYDLIHYYLHYGSPEAGSYLYFMKRYHNQHHFTSHEAGYGISSNLWDEVFGTKVILRKLSCALRW